MTEVYFVRHAEPDLSVHDDRLRPLSDRGRRDAGSLVSFFSDKKIDAVLSSPYLRAVDTVKGIAFEDQCELDIIDGFMSIKNTMPLIVQMTFDDKKCKNIRINLEEAVH